MLFFVVLHFFPMLFTIFIFDLLAVRIKLFHCYPFVLSKLIAFCLVLNRGNKSFAKIKALQVTLEYIYNIILSYLIKKSFFY